MEVNLNALPKKAQGKLQEIEEMLSTAEDRLYSIVKIDYNSGLIRFENLHFDNLFINLYSTSLTVTIEHRAEGERNNQYHYRRINHEKVNKIFSKPFNYIKRENR